MTGLIINIVAFVVFVMASQFVRAANSPDIKKNYMIVDSKALRALGLSPIISDTRLGIGMIPFSDESEMALQDHSHSIGKCGSFEKINLSSIELDKMWKDLTIQLNSQQKSNLAYLNSPLKVTQANPDSKIQAVLDQVDPNSLKMTIQMLAGYPTRYHKGSTPNIHVENLMNTLRSELQKSNHQFEIKLISHKSTPQKSLQVRLIGSQRPSEIIVLGGHLDSITRAGGNAPGTDDNASGSSNLIEALKLILKQDPTERTLDFFWYAGEEGGLLGSAEIAEQYSKNQEDVVAVLQLDMTLHAGDGDMVISNIEDYTSAWLHDYLRSISTTYLNLKILSDECGYACSDHASWYRKGFSTLMPFESGTSSMNFAIHTPKDVVNEKSSFIHSSVFTKIAIIMALDLGNSNLRRPN